MNPLRFYLKKAAGIFLGLLFLLDMTIGSSFDCRKARTKIEKLICSDDEFGSKLDESLGEVYFRCSIELISRANRRKPKTMAEV